MKAKLVAQFGQPTGRVGWLVGVIMSFENRERNSWAVAQLNIQPTDNLLEIGFGPGLAIRRAADQAAEGFVAGIDRSDVMVRQARRRNAAMIQAGRVDVQRGEVDALPYGDEKFDKVYTVNSLHHWPDVRRGLHEVYRVLKPGGLVAIIEQPRKAATQEEIQRLGEGLMGHLTSAGFAPEEVTWQPMRRAPTVCVVGRKQGAVA